MSWDHVPNVAHSMTEVMSGLVFVLNYCTQVQNTNILVNRKQKKPCGFKRENAR